MDEGGERGGGPVWPAANVRWQPALAVGSWRSRGAVLAPEATIVSEAKPLR